MTSSAKRKPSDLERELETLLSDMLGVRLPASPANTNDTGVLRDTAVVIIDGGAWDDEEA